MHWRPLILNQLRFSEGPLTKLATERQLDVLPPTTPQEIFVRILANIPLEIQQWARKVLIWTLYCCTPFIVYPYGNLVLLLHFKMKVFYMKLEILSYSSPKILLVSLKNSSRGFSWLKITKFIVAILPHENCSRTLTARSILPCMT